MLPLQFTMSIWIGETSEPSWCNKAIVKDSGKMRWALPGLQKPQRLSTLLQRRRSRQSHPWKHGLSSWSSVPLCGQASQEKHHPARAQKQRRDGCIQPRSLRVDRFCSPIQVTALPLVALTSTRPLSSSWTTALKKGRWVSCSTAPQRKAWSFIVATKITRTGTCGSEAQWILMPSIVSTRATTSPSHQSAFSVASTQSVQMKRGSWSRITLQKRATF
mmetsp:Transcript_73445/g.175030  ORF Transcript_73445/g.175030 Transcript_73445/m.175030 type:complete len:218 (-) Transcript_73445:1110-1763(-)